MAKIGCLHGTEFYLIPPETYTVRADEFTGLGYRYGVIKPEELALIRQGIEANRPIGTLVRTSKDPERAHNICVGGYASECAGGRRDSVVRDGKHRIGIPNLRFNRRIQAKSLIERHSCHVLVFGR